MCVNVYIDKKKCLRYLFKYMYIYIYLENAIGGKLCGVE